MKNNYIAVDLGAESGRVMLGTVSDDKLSLEEIHRFANGPIEIKGSLRWDPQLPHPGVSSQTSPIPSSSISNCCELQFEGQLSHQLPILSPSESA